MALTAGAVQVDITPKDSQFLFGYPIRQANSELQGYIVTAQAESEGGYEVCNGLFATESGSVLVNETLEMLKQ